MLQFSTSSNSPGELVAPKHRSTVQRFSWARCDSAMMIVVLMGTVSVLVVLFIISRQTGRNLTGPAQATTAVNSESSDFDLTETSIPVSQILRGGPPKDGIPAISKPQFITAADADFLNPEDVVIGVAIKTSARAYPLRIMNYHEIVNDHVADTPIAVTYCPLCDSVCVFDCRTPLGDREFGVSGLLYNSNVLMYDRGGKPESLWSQLKTKGVSGPGLDQALKTLPVELTTWNDWKTRYPETEVLSQNTGHQRDYSVSPYGSYFSTPQLMFPVDHEDARLSAKTRILGVWAGDTSIAIPAAAFGDADNEIESDINGLKFTVRYSSESKSMRIVNSDPGVQWMYSLWFAWAAFRPDTAILTASSDEPAKK